MVPPKDGKLDGRFWISLGGLLLAIGGTFALLKSDVAVNSANIERNREQIKDLSFDLDRRFDKLEIVTTDILKELRK